MGLTYAQADELIKRGLLTPEQVYGPVQRMLPKPIGVFVKPTKPAPAIQGPCQSIWIPGWFPGLLNQWDGHHWSRRAKIKKADRDIVRFYFETCRLQRTTEPRRVSFLFIMAKGQRMFDRDAARKSANDSLVACGALFDDTPKFCYEGPVSYARALLDAQAGTLLLLEDL